MLVCQLYLLTAVRSWTTHLITLKLFLCLLIRVYNVFGNLYERNCHRTDGKINYTINSTYHHQKYVITTVTVLEYSFYFVLFCLR